MATTGNITIQGNVAGGPAGSRTFGPWIVTFTAAVDKTDVVALSSGNNTITVPTGASFCAICPPGMVNPQPNPGYGGTLTLKGVSGDTGVPMSVKNPTILEWETATAPSTFVINASGTTTVELWYA